MASSAAPTPASTPKPTSSSGTVRPGSATLLRATGRATFAWVVVFIGFHVYWVFGGHFGFGDAPTTTPTEHTLAVRVFSVVVDVMFVVGTLVPLALYQRWGARVPTWILASCCWIGGVLLTLRGLSGLLDTSLRGSGLMRNGLTGLTYEQELGEAHPTAYTLWSGTAIDLYFTFGGVLFLAAAVVYRRVRRGRWRVRRG